MDIITLEAMSHEQIHAAFVAAFSDYAVPLNLSTDQLAEMLRRRGYRGDLSVGAVDDEVLAGFTLNGFGPFDGALCGYDTGSGVLLPYRRRGIARELLDRSIALLRAAGAKRYVLEVLESNAGADVLYAACGFEQSRTMTCWKLECSPARDPAIEITEKPGSVRAEWADWTASWQNSPESIARAAEPRITLSAHVEGRVVGGLVLFPSNGDVAQFAVEPESRRKGVATALFATARERSAAPLRIVNIDERHQPTQRFLEAIGAHMFVRQRERILEL